MTSEDLPARTPDVSNAAWLHDVMVLVAQAAHAGDRAQVNRLREHTLGQGGPALLNVIDEALRAAQLATMLAELQVPAGSVSMPVGRSMQGHLVCDFCTDLTVVAYYPFEPFTLPDPAGTPVDFGSGDKWYVCARCRVWVDVGDWAAIRDWVGVASDANRVLWAGFRANRTGPAVPLA